MASLGGMGRKMLVGAMGFMLVAAVSLYQDQRSSAGEVSLAQGKVLASANGAMAAVDQGMVHRLDAKLGSDKKAASNKGVQTAALDIAKVISEGKADEQEVQNVIHRSRTHGGDNSAAVKLEKDLASIHSQASAKKDKAKAGLKAKAGGETNKAIDSALDISRAGSKIKEARQEALAIAKVLEDSKKIVANADTIEKHSRQGNKSNIWTSFWNSKHSLVSRLAKEVGAGDKKKA